MFKNYAIKAAAVVLISMLGMANAHAWFKFKNSTPNTVWVSFQWYSPATCANSGKWETKGWWQLAPGETKTVFGNDLQTIGKYYYYYAESSNGTVWNGPFNTYASNTAFDWCLNTGSTNSRILGFREKYIGTFNNYTINLTQ